MGRTQPKTSRRTQSAPWRRALNDLATLSAHFDRRSAFIEAFLHRLQSRLRCQRVTYLRCEGDKEAAIVDGFTYPHDKNIAPTPASDLTIFGERVTLSREESYKASEGILFRPEAVYRGYVLRTRILSSDEQHILCVTFGSGSSRKGVNEGIGVHIPLAVLNLLVHTAKSLERGEIEARRGTRVQAIERIMRKTGNVKEVAAEICSTLRHFLEAPAIRLWILNRKFKNLDLLFFDTSNEYETLTSLTLNRLSERSLGMEAIKRRCVMREREPWNSKYWQSDTALLPLLESLPTFVCIPVISADSVNVDEENPRMVGLIDLHYEDNSDAPEDDSFLLFLGKIIAAALLRARSFERFAVTTKLNRIALRFVNPRNRRTLEEQRTAYLDEVLRITSEALNVNCVSIFEADETGEALRCVATTGLDIPKESAVYRQGGDLTWHVFSRNQPFIAQTLDAELSFPEKRKIIDNDISPLLAIPLAGEHRATGVIRVREKKWHYDERRLQRFSTHDMTILETIAASVSPILQMIRMQAHRELFIERTAHQVNQPLQGVIAYTSNILDGLYDKDLTKREQKLRYIRQMAKACAGMMRSNVWLAGVTDFSDLRDATRREPKRVAEYFIERIIDLQPIREAEGIKVELINPENADSLGEFWTDEVFFEQAVQNILHNAVKYSYPNTVVRVRLEREGASLAVHVTSVGVPIPLSERERIFWDRERGSVASSYDQIGTGQGLYIARQIMRGLHGDILLLDSTPEPKAKPPTGFPFAERTTFKIIYAEAFRDAL